MSGSKVKLQLTGNYSSIDKSPSPSKLMLNHGKPNFTINRQNNNYKKFHVDTELKSNEIDKVVLKNVTPLDKEDFNATNKTKNNVEFLEKFKEISEKTEKKVQIIQTEISQKDEFLEKYQKISEKLSTRDIDSLETSSLDNSGSNKNGNCVYEIKMTNEKINQKENTIQSKIQPQFAKMIDNRLQNAEINRSGFQLPPGAICGKPYIPAKPVGLTTPQTPPPPPVSNGHGTLPIYSSNNGVNVYSSTVTKNQINCQDGVNYEQKTIVSFSKDLSTAPNTYPDTAKIVISELKSNFEKTETLNEMSKLKFDIDTTGNDIVVTPVIQNI